MRAEPRTARISAATFDCIDRGGMTLGRWSSSNKSPHVCHGAPSRRQIAAPFGQHTRSRMVRGTTGEHSVVAHRDRSPGRRASRSLPVDDGGLC